LKVIKLLHFGVVGEIESLRMTEARAKEDILEVEKENKSGACFELGEDEMDENYLPDVVDLSVEDAFSRFGPGSVSMRAEEVEDFLFSYKWRPMKTDWGDPEVRESVVGYDLIDWVYDFRRVDDEGHWVKMVPSSRKRVPEPRSRESFGWLLRRCEECGWTTFSAVGCLMIRFRDLCSMWREDGRWIRNKDPRAGLVLCDDGR
jgi:hypothetical protein